MILIVGYPIRLQKGKNTNHMCTLTSESNESNESLKLEIKKAEDILKTIKNAKY